VYTEQGVKGSTSRGLQVELTEAHWTKRGIIEDTQDLEKTMDEVPGRQDVEKFQESEKRSSARRAKGKVIKRFPKHAARSTPLLDSLKGDQAKGPGQGPSLRYDTVRGIATRVRRCKRRLVCRLI